LEYDSANGCTSAPAQPMPPYAPYPFQQPYFAHAAPPPPAVEKERGPKVKNPTSFAGTDPTKLREFLAQCLLTFNAEPRRYQNDEAQVMFAASYLTEAAASWFQPFLLAPVRPSILSNWPEFVSELTQMFGDPHLASTSEQKLQTLRMRDNHYVNRYLVDFMKYSADTGWNDTALAHAFYNGLPDRIKDEMVHIGGHPRTFTDMKTIALIIDQRYHECQQEKGVTSCTASDSSRAPAASASNSSSSAPSANAPQNPSRAPRPAAAAGPSKSGPAAPGQKKPSDIAANLNTDGRLREEERKRRRERNLCLYCRDATHMVNQCPKIPSDRRTAGGTTAVGRATFVITPSEDLLLTFPRLFSSRRKTTTKSRIR